MRNKKGRNMKTRGRTKRKGKRKETMDEKIKKKQDTTNKEKK